MAVIHSNYVLCARWVLIVTPDSSFSLPGCSMEVLPLPLLLRYCLSCPRLEHRPSPILPSRVDPISQRVQAPSCFFVGYIFNCFIELNCEMYVKPVYSIVTLDAAVEAATEPVSRNSFKKQLQTLSLATAQGTALEPVTNSVRNSFRTSHEKDSQKNIPQ
jgi:hypothetical protein